MRKWCQAFGLVVWVAMVVTVVFTLTTVMFVGCEKKVESAEVETDEVFSVKV